MATLRSLGAGALAVLLIDLTPAFGQRPPVEAPFGDMVSDRLTLYDRVAPMVGTAGRLGRLGILEAKRVGFRSVIGVSTAETAAQERDMAAFALLRSFTIPIAGDVPSPEQIAELGRILSDEANLPALIHGSSDDDAAAAWALYRAAQGVPPEIAYEEGLTAGLLDHAPAVRARLGVKTP